MYHDVSRGIEFRSLAKLNGAQMACAQLVFFNRVQVCIEDFVHGEHVHTVLLEDGAHGIVAADLALVGRVLEVACFDVFPNLLDSLRS